MLELSPWRLHSRLTDAAVKSMKYWFSMNTAEKLGWKLRLMDVTHTLLIIPRWWVKQNIPWRTIHRTVILKGMCQRQHVLVMCEIRASTSSWVIPLTRRWGRINCQTEWSRVLAGCSAAGVNPKNIPNDPSCSFLWYSNKPSSLRTFCCCWKQKASDFDCLYDSYIIAQNIQ